MTWRARWLGLLLTAMWLSPGASAHAATQELDSPMFWARWVAALLLCLGLAVAGAMALKFRRDRAVAWPALPTLPALGKARSNALRRLRLVESLRIGPQLEVSLLEFDEEELLLARTAQGAVLLTRRPKRRA